MPRVEPDCEVQTGIAAVAGKAAASRAGVQQGLGEEREIGFDMVFNFL